MSLSTLLGQDKAVSVLEAMRKESRIPSALLFIGPPGVGKKKAALDWAKDLACPEDPAGREQIDKGIHPDVRLVDLAYQAGVLGEELKKQHALRIETVRHACKEVSRARVSGQWKVMILDDAERMNPAAQNGLLKFLEEPPERTTWILVTSAPDSLLPTIRSRCQPLRFRALGIDFVKTLLEKEGLDPSEVGPLATASEGSVSRGMELRQTHERFKDVEWDSPLAPFSAIEKLPKDLPQARKAVDEIFGYLLSHLRKDPETCGELARLRGLLKRNVDPKLLLQLGVLASESHASAIQRTFRDAP